jgi:hypothetical protein
MAIATIARAGGSGAVQVQQPQLVLKISMRYHISDVAGPLVHHTTGCTDVLQ